MSGEDLRQLWEDRGFTRLGLSRAAGVEAGHLWRFSVGQRKPSWKTLEALARALGVSVGRVADAISRSGPTRE